MCKELTDITGAPRASKGNQSWIFIEGLMLTQNSSTLATWCKRPWCWERLKAGGEGDNRGWDGWMASPTWWTWVWVSSRSWWWTGRPGMLQSMGSQRVRHDWANELNWTEGHLGNWIMSTDPSLGGTQMWKSRIWHSFLLVLWFWSWSVLVSGLIAF